MEDHGRPVWLLEITEFRSLNHKLLSLARKELASAEDEPEIKYVHVLTEIPFANDITQKVSDVDPQMVASFEKFTRRTMEERIKSIHSDQPSAPELHIQVNDSRGKGFCSAIRKFRATKLYISFSRSFLLGSLSKTCDYLIRKTPKYCSFIAVEKKALTIGVNVPAKETLESYQPSWDDTSSQGLSRSTSFRSILSSGDLASHSPGNHFPETINGDTKPSEEKPPENQVLIVKRPTSETPLKVNEPSDSEIDPKSGILVKKPIDASSPFHSCRTDFYSEESFRDILGDGSINQDYESNSPQDDCGIHDVPVFPETDDSTNVKPQGHLGTTRKWRPTSRTTPIRETAVDKLLIEISNLSSMVNILQSEVQNSLSDSIKAKSTLMRFREEKKLNDEILVQETRKRECTDLEARKALDEVKTLMCEIHDWEVRISSLKSNQIRGDHRMNKGLNSFNDSELHSCCDGFNEANIIGEGRFFIAYKGVLDHTDVCVKRLKSSIFESDLDEENAKLKLQKHALTQGILRHPNIVLAMGYCMEISCFVYEYMQNGSLLDRLTKIDGCSPLSWNQRFDIFESICSALKYMHSREPPMVHFGVHPSNILLDENMKAKLGDSHSSLVQFLFEENGESSQASMAFPSLNSRYMCPAFLEDKILHSSCDVYSVGMVLWDLLFGVSKRNSRRASLPELKAAVYSNDGEKLKSLLDPSANWPLSVAFPLASLTLRLTKLKREKRPSITNEVIHEVGKLRSVVNIEYNVELDIHLIESLKEKEKIKEREATHRRTNQIPAEFSCPITMDLMECPVVASDGHTYEKNAIEIWLATHETSPVTNLPMANKELRTNEVLKAMILEYVNNQG